MMPGSASARVYLDITQAQIQKLPFAIPPFLNSKSPGQLQQIGQDMSDYLGKALELHGFIALIPQAAKINKHEYDWHSLGAAYTVLGTYEIVQNSIVVEFRLLDAYKNFLEFSRRYQGQSANYHPVLQKFCDEVILHLSGEAGISSSKIAFVSTQTGVKEIYLANVIGDEIRQVTKNNYLALSPRFSPDATQLAYTSYHSGNPNLYITDLAQDKSTVLFSRRKGLNMTPAWAPDGKTMVLTLSKDGNPDLYLVDNTSKILKRLTNGVGINVSPSFAPDGNRIAFVSDRSGSPQIYVLDLTTNTTRRITFTGVYNTTPDWSPKGDLIAYSGKEGAYFQIFTVNADGNNVKRVTDNQSDHESPSWSPDGRQIVFSEKTAISQKIVTILLNGSKRHILFDHLKGEQSMPQWSNRTPL
ncbi:MAG: Tol-Pal system beta propeller repeat protein TolB [Deltaproteobacteria bacterium RIFOXYD12_FULL_50_9]|nr:MAG: Tol-Pal system beta propeller repeat protein TolB [Deltaproteobacteria bacterium RIFOXYD12_FULL_50_9]